ncbi:MAG: hypothetical protein RL328_1299 [Acidobacteriota bacterium]|jgi:hypothetical protein
MKFPPLPTFNYGWDTLQLGLQVAEFLRPEFTLVNALVVYC